MLPWSPTLLLCLDVNIDPSLILDDNGTTGSTVTCTHVNKHVQYLLCTIDNIRARGGRNVHYLLYCDFHTFLLYVSRELNVIDSGTVVFVTTILKSYPGLLILYIPGIM